MINNVSLIDEWTWYLNSQSRYIESFYGRNKLTKKETSDLAYWEAKLNEARKYHNKHATSSVADFENYWRSSGKCRLNHSKVAPNMSK